MRTIEDEIDDEFAPYDAAKQKLKDTILPLIATNATREVIMQAIPSIWVDQWTNKFPTISDWRDIDAALDANGQYLFIATTIDTDAEDIQCVIDLEGKSIDFV
jgi:hypothetical protein